MESAQAAIDLQGVARLCGLGVSTAVEDGLRAVLASNVTQPEEAVRTLVEHLQSHVANCTSSVVEEFRNQVVKLERGGFDPDGCSLFFAVPDQKGRITELFPGGAQIAVKACNYTNFRSLFSLFMEHNGEMTEAYIELARIHVPVRAQENLMCGDYAVILDFVERHLLKPTSAWNVTVNTATPLMGRLEKTIWDAYGVTEHVSFRGRLFSTRTDFYPPGKVTLEKIFDFISDARTSLQQLARAEAEMLSLSFVSPLRAQASVFLYGDGTAEHQMARLNDSIRYIAAHPHMTTDCTDTFDIPIGPKRFTLDEDDPTKLLRPTNVRTFAAQFVKKRVDIAHVINEVVQAPSQPESTTSISAARLRVCPPELSQQWNTVRLQPRDREAVMKMIPEPLKAAHRMRVLTDTVMASFDLVFAIPVVEGTYRLIPDGEHVTVTQADVEEFILRVERELTVLDSRDTHSGVGTHPAGTQRNGEAAKQVDRGGFVAQRSSMIANARQADEPLRAVAGTAAAGSALQGYRAQSAPAAEQRRESGPVAFTPSPPQRDSLPSRKVHASHVTACTDLACGSSTPIVGFLSQADVPNMDELDVQLQLLAEDHLRILPEQWDEMKFTWVLCVPGTTVVLPLFDGGSRRPVELDEIVTYVEVARAMLRRVRAIVVETGSFPPPSAAQSMNDPIQQSIFASRNAVPETPTEQDRALFSPTHEVNNLFAPIERMN